LESRFEILKFPLKLTCAMVLGVFIVCDRIRENDDTSTVAVQLFLPAIRIVEMYPLFSLSQKVILPSSIFEFSKQYIFIVGRVAQSV